MNSQDNTDLGPSPIFDDVEQETGVTPEPPVEEPVSDNMPGATLGTGPWPNQEPVVDGIDEVSQDADFIQEDRVTK